MKVFTLIFLSYFFTVTSAGIKLKVCKNVLNGQPCTISCVVQDFEDAIVFYHPPVNSVGSCVVNEQCSSRLNYVIVRDIAKKQANLTIPQVDKTMHGGYWKCSYGALESETELLQIYDLPNESKTIYITGEEGMSISLICDLYPAGQPFSTTWYFNNAQVQYDERRKISSVDNSTLIIKALDTDDRGFYQCTMVVPSKSENIKFGPIISLYKIAGKKSHCYVVEGERTERTTTTYISPEKGLTLRLVCDLNPTSRSFSITWYFNGLAIQDDERLSISDVDNSTLVIKKLDKNDRGLYHCSMHISKESENIIKGSYINLYKIIDSNDELTEGRSTMYISGNKGQTLSLVCDLKTSDPNFSITWYINKSKIQYSERFSISNIENSTLLNIKNLQDKDKGLYHCSMAISNTNVIIKDGPYISLHKVIDRTVPSHLNALLGLVIAATGVNLILTIIVVIFFKVVKRKRTQQYTNVDTSSCGSSERKRNSDSLQIQEPPFPDRQPEASLQTQEPKSIERQLEELCSQCTELSGEIEDIKKKHDTLIGLVRNMHNTLLQGDVGKSSSGTREENTKL